MFEYFQLLWGRRWISVEVPRVQVDHRTDNFSILFFRLKEVCVQNTNHPYPIYTETDVIKIVQPHYAAFSDQHL